MPTNNINLTAPTDASVNALELQRRMALADQLRQASLQSPNNEMVGGVVVKQSPLQGLGRLAQALMAKKISGENDEKMQAMAAQQAQQRDMAIDQFGEIDPAIKAGLKSSDPFVRQLATARLEATQKAADKRAELEQKATDAKAMQAERLAAQAEQAKREEALRRDLATQHGDLLRSLAAQKAAAAAENPKNAPKLPPTALKMQQEELDAIGTASTINADLGAVQKQIEAGQLQLGPVNNLMSQAKNSMGMSDESSRNFATFQATLEKLRNDSLRLNKGVQTDGDAQRAWNELMANIKDPQVVRQRLGEIQKINERAVALRKMNVENIRRNFGLDSMDTSGYENQPAAIGGGEPPAGAVRRKK